MYFMYDIFYCTEILAYLQQQCTEWHKSNSIITLIHMVLAPQLQPTLAVITACMVHLTPFTW